MPLLLTGCVEEDWAPALHTIYSNEQIDQTLRSDQDQMKFIVILDFVMGDGCGGARPLVYISWIRIYTI